MADNDDPQPIRSLNKFVMATGIIGMLCLGAYGCWELKQLMMELEQKYGSLNKDDKLLKDHIIEINIMLFIKFAIFVLFPFASLLELLCTIVIRIWPSLGASQLPPPFFLFQTILTLVYLWFISIFQIINSIAVLSNDIGNDQAWFYMFLYVLKCLFIFFALLMYLVLIQVVSGYRQIINVLKLRNLRRELRLLQRQLAEIQNPPEQDNDVHIDVNETPPSPNHT